MLKGSRHAGSSLFVGFFLIMLLVAGYLYFFGDQNEAATPADFASSSNLTTSLVFYHPLRNYSLVLPYYWQNKYQVEESSDQTDFWYVTSTSQKDLLFSLIRQPVKNQVFGSAYDSIKKIGGDETSSYYLALPDRAKPALDADNERLRSDVSAIGSSFKLEPTNLEQEIIELLVPINLTSSSLTNREVTFVVFETIATEEKATSTDHYIWYQRQRFTWDFDRLKAWPLFTGQAKIILSKDETKALTRIDAKYSAKDLIKFFPTVVRNNSLILVGSEENLALTERLSEKLKAKIIAYFGAEPLISVAGKIINVREQDGRSVLAVILGEPVPIKTASGEYGKTSPLTVILNNKKTVSDFFFSSTASPLIMTDASGTQQIYVPESWSSLFASKTASVLKNKFYWLEIQANQIRRISPLSP